MPATRPTRSRRLGSMTFGRVASFALLAVSTLLAGCGADPAPGPAYPPPGAYVPPQGPPPGAYVPPPGTPPSAWSAAFADLTSRLPCPPPGLPPELASLIDCAAMRRIAGAAAFVPRQVAAGMLPREVDLRARGLTGPVKDQQQVGACAGFAMSSVLDNATRRAGRGDVVAPLHVFATYSGSSLSALKGRPMTVEPVWPYHAPRACALASEGNAEGCGAHYGVVPGSGRANPALMAEKARADASGLVRIDGFEEISAPADTNQIAALLADGEAVWVALLFERGAWQSSDVARTGYLPYYPAQVTTVGHAVTLEGYRFGPTGREFLFKNSWGTDWGMGGYAWIPDSMLATHLMFAYRVRTTLSSVPTNAPPSSGGPMICLPGIACVDPAAWSAAAVPWSAQGLGLPAIPSCPAGTIPDLLSGGCMKW